MLASEAGKRVGWQRRAVAKRLAVLVYQVRQPLDDIFGCQERHMMFKSEKPCHPLRVRDLAQGSFFESNGEGWQIAPVSGCEGSDQ
jgi:hypothetical protein